MINDRDLEHLIDADPQDYQRDDPEEEYDKFLEVLDAKVDSIKLNLDKATKVCDDLIESAKKFQSGLLPEDNLDLEAEAELINEANRLAEDIN